jgi:hypothetical protein
MRSFLLARIPSSKGLQQVPGSRQIPWVSNKKEGFHQTQHRRCSSRTASEQRAATHTGPNETNAFEVFQKLYQRDYTERYKLSRFLEQMTKLAELKRAKQSSQKLASHAEEDYFKVQHIFPWLYLVQCMLPWLHLEKQDTCLTFLPALFSFSGAKHFFGGHQDTRGADNRTRARHAPENDEPQRTPTYRFFQMAE